MTAARQMELFDESNSGGTINWNDPRSYLVAATTIRTQDCSLMSSLARKICCELDVVVCDKSCEMVEIEFYITTPEHPDPFTHCHELQREFGNWYLHRVGTGIRNGSFKGIDFTVGDGNVHAAVLLRSIRTADGQLVSGPSLCVDYLIDECQVSDVHELNTVLSKHDIFSLKNAVHLRVRETARDVELFSTARVGLSAKGDQSFAGARYRFLTEPRGIKKGRRELIAAMLSDGISSEDIARRTGSPRKTILTIQSSLHDSETNES